MMEILLAIVVFFVFGAAPGRLFGKLPEGLLSLQARFILGFAVSCLFVSSIMLVLGLTGLLTKGPFVALLFVLSALAIMERRFIAELILDSVQRFKAMSSEKGPAGFLLYAVFLSFVAYTLISSAPVFAPDALNYHFALPKIYLDSERLVDLRGYFYAYLPRFAEMNNMFFIGIRNEIFANIFNSFFAVISSAAVFITAKEMYDRRVALLASLLFYLLPLLAWEACASFVEIQLVFFALLSLYSMSIYLKSGLKRFLVLSGLFMGTALSVKQYAVIIFPIAMFLLVRGLSKRGISKKCLALWTVLAVIFGSPWYILNLINTGNPVFPLFFGFLGGRGWNLDADRAFMDFHGAAYGIAKNIPNFLRLPFALTLEGESFDQGELLGPAILLLSPLAFLARRRIRESALLFIAIVIYCAVWFLGSQQARFLVPIVPAMLVLMSSGFFSLEETGGKAARRTARVSIVLFVFFSFFLTINYGERVGKYLVGMESGNSMLVRLVGGYENIKWMNLNLSKNDKVLFYGNGPYYMDIPYLVGRPEVQGLIDYSAIRSADDFLRLMKDLKTNCIYVYGRYSPDDRIKEDVWEQMVRKNLKVIRQSGAVVSYENGEKMIDTRRMGTVYRLR